MEFYFHHLSPALGYVYDWGIVFSKGAVCEIPRDWIEDLDLLVPMLRLAKQLIDPEFY